MAARVRTRGWGEDGTCVHVGERGRRHVCAHGGGVRTAARVHVGDEAGGTCARGGGVRTAARVVMTQTQIHSMSPIQTQPAASLPEKHVECVGLVTLNLLHLLPRSWRNGQTAARGEAGAGKQLFPGGVMGPRACPHGRWGGREGRKGHVQPARYLHGQGLDVGPRNGVLPHPQLWKQT